MTALVLGVAAVVIVVLAAQEAWYSLDAAGISTLEYRLDSIVSRVSFDGASAADSATYAEAGLPAQGRVASTAYWLSIGAIVALAAGVAACAAQIFLRTPSAKLRPVAGLLLVLGGLAALAAPLAFGLSLPGAFEEDVGAASGSSIVPQNHFAGQNAGFTWGPQMGWFVAAAAAVPATIGAALVLAEHRAERRVAEASGA